MARKNTPGPWTYKLDPAIGSENMWVGQLFQKGNEKAFAVVILDGDFDKAENNIDVMAQSLELEKDCNDFADKITATHHYLMGVEQDQPVENIIGELFELLGYTREGLRDVPTNDSLFDAEF